LPFPEFFFLLAGNYRGFLHDKGEENEIKPGIDGGNLGNTAILGRGRDAIIATIEGPAHDEGRAGFARLAPDGVAGSGDGGNYSARRDDDRRNNEDGQPKDFLEHKMLLFLRDIERHAPISHDCTNKSGCQGHHFLSMKRKGRPIRAALQQLFLR
jgi:hypothetical protein